MYPRGGNWLERRLDDALDGHATCSVVTAGGFVAAVAIETPKAAGIVKLSTIWVAPAMRGLGIGSALVEVVTGRWVRGGVRHGYVTASAGEASVLGLLGRCRFSLVNTEPDRYGEGRDELVLSWEPGA